MHTRNSHCSYCGAAFAPDAEWPRTCARCQNVSYLNPTPVAVLIVPIDDGVLTVRRAIPPQIGQLALPGGFIVLGESWQTGGVREVFEETGVQLDAADITLLGTESTPNGASILIFGVAPQQPRAVLDQFQANDETAEIVIVSTPIDLAFPLHTAALRRWFAVR